MSALLRFLSLIFLNLFFLSSSYALDSVKSITIKILAINDFHGQITTGRKLNDRPVGGAAVLASYLKQGKSELADDTLLAFSGDQVGASPPASGLLNHEPSILFFNTLANSHCKKTNLMNPKCNVVATIGNHEFDQGVSAMLDLINGTDKPPTDHWIPLATYPGASFPYISANIVDAKTGKLLFKPYIIKKIKGIKIAFIGAILKDAPDVILPKKIEGIKFLDEADAINSYVPEIKAQGVDVIVVNIHQGGDQTPYEGPTQENTKVTGPIVSIIDRLDDNIDVVMGGHYHLFMNAYLPNQHGKKILVTEASCYSSAFAEVTLSLDAKKHTLLNKTARIITTYADQWPGNLPDIKAQQLVKMAEDKIEPIIISEIGTLKDNLYKKANQAGESTLGNLIADGYKGMFNADIGLTNPGAIRADLFAGKVTWGNLYAVQPFSNSGLVMTLTGQDIYDLFEQQWTTTRTIILQIAGLTYSYDAKKPLGNRVVAIYYDNELLQKDKLYTIGTNEFLAGGGDGFTIMKKGKVIKIDSTDLEVLINHVKSLPQPFSSEIDGRIKAV
jgi:5'-nucleotidase